jgi:hypothetical protein
MKPRLKNKKQRVGWLSTAPRSSERRWRGAPLQPQEAFKKAAARVGRKPLQRLLWLLELIQRPRKELAAELGDAFCELAFEIAYFAGASDPRIFSPDVLVPALDLLEASCRTLATTPTAPWTLRMPPVRDLVISRDDDAPEPSFDSSDPTVSLLLRADAVIGAERRRVHQCASADCRRLFVKRKRGAFCSRRCTLRESMRNWRASLGKSEINRRQRDYYDTKKRKSEVNR